MKINAFIAVSYNILKKELPLRRLLDNCLIKPNAFFTSIIENDETTFFKLLPSQSKKDLNAVCFFKGIINYKHPNFYRNVSIFVQSLETGNKNIIHALVETGKIDWTWKTDEGIDQFALLCQKGYTQAIDLALKHIKNIKKINKYSYLEYLSLGKSSHNDGLLEVEVAKKMIDMGVDLQHVGERKEGNALNLAVQKSKPELIEFLLNTDIQKDYSKNTLKLFGCAIFFAYRYDFEKIEPIVKSLLTHGIEYKDDMAVLASYDDKMSDNLKETLKIAQKYIDIFEEKKNFEHLLGTDSFSQFEPKQDTPKAKKRKI